MPQNSFLQGSRALPSNRNAVSGRAQPRLMDLILNPALLQQGGLSPLQRGGGAFGSGGLGMTGDSGGMGIPGAMTMGAPGGFRMEAPEADPAVLQAHHPTAGRPGPGTHVNDTGFNPAGPPISNFTGPILPAPGELPAVHTMFGGAPTFGANNGSLPPGIDGLAGAPGSGRAAPTGPSQQVTFGGQEDFMRAVQEAGGLSNLLSAPPGQFGGTISSQGGIDPGHDRVPPGTPPLPSQPAPAANPEGPIAPVTMQDIGQNPAFGAFKSAIERSFDDARRRAMETGAAGGALTSTLGDIEGQRAGSLAQAMGNLAMQEQQRRFDERGFHSGLAEAQRNRDFAGTQAGLDRDFTGGQNALNRNFAGDQAGLDRGLTQSENALDRQIQNRQIDLNAQLFNERQQAEMFQGLAGLAGNLFSGGGLFDFLGDDGDGGGAGLLERLLGGGRSGGGGGIDLGLPGGGGGGLPGGGDLFGDDGLISGGGNVIGGIGSVMDDLFIPPEILNGDMAGGVTQGGGFLDSLFGGGGGNPLSGLFGGEGGGLGGFLGSPAAGLAAGAAVGLMPFALRAMFSGVPQQRANVEQFHNEFRSALANPNPDGTITVMGARFTPDSLDPEVINSFGARGDFIRTADGRWFSPITHEFEEGGDGAVIDAVADAQESSSGGVGTTVIPPALANVLSPQQQAILAQRIANRQFQFDQSRGNN